MGTIDSFKGENAFLSNFYNAPVCYDGITYKNSEAAFQAQKTENREDRFAFADLSARDAKKLGRSTKLRKGWSDMRVYIMSEIVHAKFEQNPDLAEKLLATGNDALIEGNTWNDKFWGVDSRTGEGQNMLGNVLMGVRTTLRREDMEAENMEAEDMEAEGTSDECDHCVTGIKDETGEASDNPEPHDTDGNCGGCSDCSDNGEDKGCPVDNVPVFRGKDIVTGEMVEGYYFSFPAVNFETGKVEFVHMLLSWEKTVCSIASAVSEVTGSARVIDVSTLMFVRWEDVNAEVVRMSDRQ